MGGEGEERLPPHTLRGSASLGPMAAPEPRGTASQRRLRETRLECGHCLWGCQRQGGVGDWIVTARSAHGHTLSGPGVSFGWAAGPSVQATQAHLEGIKALANKVGWPFSG